MTAAYDDNDAEADDDVNVYATEDEVAEAEVGDVCCWCGCFETELLCNYSR